MKHIIGVVGENGSGKATFTTFLRAAATPLDVTPVRFSGVLVQTLKLWGIAVTRVNLQKLAIAMDGQYGQGSVTAATKIKIEAAESDLVIVEGVRWKTDVPMVKSFPDSLLVYVTADPKLRFERLKARGEREDEKDKTYEQFLEEEKAGTEVEIPEIGAGAEFKIENNGTLEEFRYKVEEFYHKNIRAK